MLQVRTEDIYQATSDDEAFAGLSNLIAKALGARSGVLHWSDQQARLSEMSHSGYFKPEHMDRLSSLYADADIWSEAVRSPTAMGRMWQLDELVPEDVYRGSAIYNEWVRPIGDDTYWCMGGSLRIGSATLELGFHRGRGDRPFNSRDVSALSAISSHLRVLVSVRKELIQARVSQRSLAAAQDVFGYGIITMDAAGRVLHTNRAADLILTRQDSLVRRAGLLHAVNSNDELALSRAMDRVKDSAASCATSLLLARNDGGCYQLSIASSFAGADRQISLIINDPQQRDQSLPSRLRKMHGLSMAESEIAVALTEGSSVKDIASARLTSTETVRAQVKSIFAKTGVNRQSELASLVQSSPKLASG